MKDFLKRNPARVYAVAVAALGLAVVFLPALPVAPVLALVAAVLALFGGEVVQRTENVKTADALATEVPAEPDEVVPDQDLAL